MEESSPIRNNYSYRGGKRFTDLWTRDYLRGFGSLRGESLAMSLARDCGVKISLTSDRENTILSFPSLASNDLSNFKEEEGEVFSTVVDNSNGPRLVSKKCRPFSREERNIYTWYKSWIYISRKLGGFERRNLSVSIKLVSYRWSRC